MLLAEGTRGSRGVRPLQLGREQRSVRTETALWNRVSICLEGFHHRLPKSDAITDNVLR